MWFRTTILMYQIRISNKKVDINKVIQSSPTNRSRKTTR